MFDLLIKLLEKIAGTEQKPIELNITPVPEKNIQLTLPFKQPLINSGAGFAEK